MHVEQRHQLWSESVTSSTLTVAIGQRKGFQKTKLVLKVTQAYGNIGADVSDLSH